MQEGPNPALAVKNEEELHWLALRLVPGLGNRVAMRLLNAIGSVTGIFRASATELESLGVPSQRAERVCHPRRGRLDDIH